MSFKLFGLPQLLARTLTPSPLFRSALALRPLQSPFSTSPISELMRKCTGKKLKTHKGAAKRWLVIGNGGYKRSKAGRVHLNGHLSPTRLNRLGQVAFASPIQKKLLRRLLPYA